MIKAITFDLWDTVFIDDSDEPKRKAAGKPPKSIERRQLVHQFITKRTSISQELVDKVYDAIDGAFNKVWHEHHVTWSVREQLELILNGLRKKLPAIEMNELIRLHEDMELEFRPDIVPGIHDALKRLHGRYKLGVISDTIFSPGRALRTLLADEGLLDFFDALVFSDEVGRSKPEPILFYTACKGFQIEPHELVHIGDREHNDILSPQKLGIRTVLCTAIIDRGSKNTKAHAIFDNYQNLPDIIEMLNK